MTIFITFFLIKKTIGLRVTPHEEIAGLDKEEHGLDNAYAGFAMETETSPYAPIKIDVPASREVVVDVEDAVPVKARAGFGDVSQVTIITKPDRFEALKNELEAIGIGGMTVTNVMGMGVQKGQTSYYRGAEVDSKLLPKMKVEIVVSEVPVRRSWMRQDGHCIPDRSATERSSYTMWKAWSVFLLVRRARRRSSMKTSNLL